MNIANMVLQDGDFPASYWVRCEADCCERLHGRGAGWFAIRRGEAHYVDPDTFQHVHADCFAELQSLEHGSGVNNNTSVTRVGNPAGAEDL